MISSFIYTENEKPSIDRDGDIISYVLKRDGLYPP